MTLITALLKTELMVSHDPAVVLVTPRCRARQPAADDQDGGSLGLPASVLRLVPATAQPGYRLRCGCGRIGTGVITSNSKVPAHRMQRAGAVQMKRSGGGTCASTSDSTFCTCLCARQWPRGLYR